MDVSHVALVGRWTARPRITVALGATALVVDLLLSANLGSTFPLTHRFLMLSLSVASLWLLGWRRQRPMTMFVLASTFSVLCTLLVDGYRPFVMVLIAVHATARYSKPTNAGAAVVLSLIPAAVAAYDEGQTITGEARVTGIAVTLMTYLFFFVAAWQLGLRGAATQQRLEESRRREQEAELTAAARERRRLANELHDVISHTVTVMMLQAAGARRLVGVEPPHAADALEQIELSGQSALHELRRLIDLIDTDPQELMVSIASLRETTRGLERAGVPVSWENELGTGLAASSTISEVVKIVEECLTNAVRHGRRRGLIHVRAESSRDWLEIEVGNELAATDLDRNAEARGPGGRGLKNIRGRVFALEGEVLHSGPAGTGAGWSVCFRIPLHPLPRSRHTISPE